jgi:hypothetical protein
MDHELPAKETQIEEKFAERFAHWEIRLPPGAVGTRARGLIQKAGWTIRYIFGEQGGEHYLEYYATHRMTGDTRKRIYESGRIEDLPAIAEFYVSDPKIEGDEERAKAEYLEYNRKIADELQRLGLYPDGDINAYLRTHDVPKP